MAEEGSVCELEGLQKQLESLLSRYSSDEPHADSKPFCSDFCKLVEVYASRWQVPLPQLRILEIALRYFAQASTFFTTNCDHVLLTLSSLALSVFELLLFFDQKDFHQEPLKHFTVTFQECHSALARHQNVHLLQVERLVRGGGPWAGPALQAILSESSLPQSEGSPETPSVQTPAGPPAATSLPPIDPDLATLPPLTTGNQQRHHTAGGPGRVVGPAGWKGGMKEPEPGLSGEDYQTLLDGCISSEVPVFFELRVHYLLSCERVSEAMALAKCCAAHPTAGQHLFFLQVYLTWLFKTSQLDRLHKEVAEFNGKDAVHIICSLECEETDELLLALSRAFLSQQLRRGDMYYLCDLVFIWSKLHSRLSTSKQALLEESHQLMLSATNVNSIFPFIRAILQELGEDGIQFCVELCVNALGSCRPCDVITKSLIYKTIAGLLPNDLEVSRACALLVFFLECTVETYKMVYLLYMHPDQEYHVECSPIRNHVRFETLQVLKKDLYFDPEFWNLIALRTNCLKLMSKKVVSGALEEIMEDKWILSYCTKEPASRSHASVCQRGRKKRHHKEDANAASKRLKVGPGKTRLSVDHTVKKKGNQGSSSEPLRRSFWQLDRLQDNGELRRTTRLSEKNPPKRRIRKPKWLLEDSGSLGENDVFPKIKKQGLKLQKQHGSFVVKRSEMGELKYNAKHKPSVTSHFMARENSSKHRRGFSLDSPKPDTSPQVILELSLPDNELMGTFTEDACNRQRGFPQVLLYRPTVKVPAVSQPVKTVHRKEVILRARDAAMFAQQLHCYARRQKGKGNRLNTQGSVSTITRSSVQGSPPKDPLGEKPATEVKGGIVSQTPAAAEITKSPVLQVQPSKTVSQKTFSGRELSEKCTAEMKVTSTSQTSAATDLKEAPMLDKVLHAQNVASARELCEESAVEMKVTIASTAANVTPSPGLDKVSKAVTEAVEVSQTSTADNSQITVTDKFSNVGAADSTPSQSQDVVKDEKQHVKSVSSQVETGKDPIAKAGAPEVLAAVSNSISEVKVTDVSPSKGHVPCKIDTSSETEVTTSPPPDRESIHDISALTLVTEMVTELVPEALARDLENRKQPAPEVSSSMGSTAGSKSNAPRKLRTASSCSVAADVQGKEEGTWDVEPETPENHELPESEESKLEYCCTFCNKVFKGSRVVAHAMFHYRKDECMFCGTMFKDDLLAMMHLSDHIEKLKKSKKSQENWVSETKDNATPKTSTEAKIANVSSGRRSRGRPRKSTDCPQSASPPDSHPSGSRKLRSSGKPVDGQPLHEKKQNVLKHLHSKTPVHKINGHIGKKKELDRPKKDTLKSEAKQPLKQQEISKHRAKDGAERLQEHKDVEMDSSATSAQFDKGFILKKTDLVKKTAKQSRKVVEEKNVELQEKLCCPAEGCGWFTDLSKNRVALLYHALEHHYGEVKPLELAFRVGNSKCGSCMRVMWSFEHFQHHVERHRLAPRHPCLHQGCSARFKSGMEMRRHTRRHSPLQAVCCLPGCSQLFICLWALNLHEREHYAARPTKPDKNTNEQTGDTPDREKQPSHKSEDSAVNRTVSVKDDRKLRGEATHNLTGKHIQASLPTVVSASLLKEESKDRNETKDSQVLKNLSNKDTSAQPTGPNLRLRQTLRKLTNTTKSHQVISSSLKRNNKVRHKFKKKQVKVNTKGPKRRGRPPKSKEAVHDENTTAGPNNQAASEKTAPLASLPKAAETSSVSQKEETSRQVRDAGKAKSVNKQMKKNHVKQKGISRNTSTAVVTANSVNQSITAASADKTHKLTAKKLPKVKKRSVPNETASLDSGETKKHKVTDSQANAEIVEIKCPLKEAEGKEKAEISTQNGNSAPADGLHVRTAPSTSSGETTQTAEKKKPHMTKDEKKDTTSSGSGKTNKKHKDINKKGDKMTLKGRCKDASKTSALEKKSKCVDQQVEAKATAESSDVKHEAKVGGSFPAATASGLNEPAAEESTQTVTKKEKSRKSVTKKTEKASQKRKSVQKEGDTKIVKKTCKDQGVPSANSEPLAEVKAGVVERPGYSVIMNGQAAKEEVKSTALKDALAEYRHTPYMRLPPTAYLDEKYITMPKRRKELSFFQSSQWSPPPQHASVTTALQRQRCANCFATFNSAEELQSHLQLQTCSNLFGFDSDDEGSGLTCLIKSK